MSKVRAASLLLAFAHVLSAAYSNLITQAPDLLASLGLAIQSKIAPYDAEYLVLARELDTFCVTADRELVRKAPSLAKSMEEFCARH